MGRNFETEADAHWRASHRDGVQLPSVTLQSTQGPVDVASYCSERAVLYVYPATGVPGRDPAIDPAPGWDEIPGAAGCTPQSLGFKDLYETFASLGIRVAGVSTQPLAEQTDFAARYAIPFALMCDEQLRLQSALNLPAFNVGRRVFLKRLVLYIEHGRIHEVLYPVENPAQSAQEALSLVSALRK